MLPWSRGHGKKDYNFFEGCIKTRFWFVYNYSPFGLKTKQIPLLQYRFPVGFGPSSKT